LAKVKGNICALSFPQKHFDLIICYHVLEHIVDDYSAIQELQRVLAVEGLMLLQVPIKGDATYEDLTVTNPFERARLFGQKDHVRFYGRDFRDRVASVGLRVEEVDFAAEASDEVIQRYGLRRGELSYICRR
jgi:SAM-dependent methyltransferase